MPFIKPKILTKVNYTFNIPMICLISCLIICTQCKTPKNSEAKELVEQESTSVSTANVNTEIDITAVQWTHSREDDHDGLLHYKNPATTTFPPSRFRNSMKFNADGSCAYMQLSPTDRHQMVDATYTYTDGEIVITRASGRPYKRYQVISLEEDTLILKQIKQSTDY